MPALTVWEFPPALSLLGMIIRFLTARPAKGKTLPAAAVIITGAEHIPHINAFLGELIGGTAMSFLRLFFFFPIVGDMDCSSVTILQDMQRDVMPEQVTTQKRDFAVLCLPSGERKSTPTGSPPCSP
jgi:hypothetical protein